MYQEIIDKIKPNLDKAIEYLKNELNTLQVGRVSPSLVEDIQVECYGSKMPLKQLAAISCPQPRIIIIDPWDKSIIKDIEKGIIDSKLGLNPIIDGEVIRLVIPPLDEEQRKNLTKVLSQKVEEVKISIRTQREKAWKEIQSLYQEGKISEDEKYKGKDKLQEVIDEYNKKVEELKERKEKEILNV